jgi:diaminopropionate ammonia-lyase
MTQAELASFESARVDHLHNDPSGDGEGNATVISQEGARAAWNRITAWDGYVPSPLVPLPGLATALGVADVMFKDESGRFGLGSFKALGGAYAVSCLLAEEVGATPEDLMSGSCQGAVETITVTSATDGNHGRSVAWGARTCGCPCVIYIHADVSESRAKAIEDLGAQVIRIAGNYDESVRRCSEDAETHGRFVVSDTSYEGYREVPRRVMEGYTVMVTELIEQSAGVLPTHVFVQGGVGGLAAAVHDIFRHRWGADRPRFVIVEPALAACLYASAVSGEPRSVAITEETLMAGLSCGEVSLLAWESLAEGADDFLTIPESLVAPTMRILARSPFGDAAVTAGESGVAGLAGAIAAARSPALGAAIGLDGRSRVFAIGTEGATDPEIYARLVNPA